MKKRTRATRDSRSDACATRGPGGAWGRWLEGELPRIEVALRDILRLRRDVPLSLQRAMRYAVFPGGKRLRPVLAVLGHRTCGGRSARIYRVAASLELVHTFTLIHDDLPCIDNDDYRRGRPSCHRAFGEALAVLAGDALLNRAYEVLSEERDVARRAAAIRSLARAVGGTGVLGGQVDDIAAEGRRVTEETLRGIHRRKTASLISASLRIGAEFAGATRESLRVLDRFGDELGLLFQIVDDILNVEGSEKDLGRPAGSDARLKKATYPRIVGALAARSQARRRARAASRTAATFGRMAPVFEDLVHAVASRVDGVWPEDET